MEKEKVVSKNFNIKVFDDEICETIDTVFARAKKIYGNKNDYLVACLINGANEIAKSIGIVEKRKFDKRISAVTIDIATQICDQLFDALESKDDEEL